MKVKLNEQEVAEACAIYVKARTLAEIVCRVRVMWRGRAAEVVVAKKVGQP